MSLTNPMGITRSKGDPRVLRQGPSSLTGADRLGRALGLADRGGLVRLYGARELASAVATLSVNRRAGLVARIAEDVQRAQRLLQRRELEPDRLGRDLRQEHDSQYHESVETRA